MYTSAMQARGRQFAGRRAVRGIAAAVLVASFGIGAAACSSDDDPVDDVDTPTDEPEELPEEAPEELPEEAPEEDVDE